jgi:uncharacterized membrane protein YccC
VVFRNVGFREIIFSVNCFIAVMLSLFIAFRLELKNPWWAMITVYLTSQTLSGAMRAKAVYRIIGTLISGVVMLIIVPNLVDAPELTAAAIILWVAFCLYVSLLDRTPRSYMFALAGYTAALVGFPSALDPGGIWDTAIGRMEEIVLGTVCAAVVHSVVFPRSVTSALFAKQTAMLTNARRWIAEGLGREPTPEIEREQRQIAADVTELAILATSLPYDTASRRPNSKLVRAFDERLVALLPLLSTIEDRIALLRRSGLSQQIERLIAAVADWCARTDGGESAEAERLKRECLAAMPEAQLQASWTDLITVSLLGRVHELIDSWHDCLELAALMRNPSSTRSRGIRATIAGLRAKPLHVDHGIAALSALTAALAISICCAFWIATAWPQGAVATGFVAVICSLFAALDDPTPTMSTLTTGIVASIPIAALYQFAILPAIDGYVALVVCLAPPLLLFGAVMAIPQYTALGLAPILGFTVLLAFQPQYTADMASFLNSAIAVVIGSLVGIATTRLTRVMGAQASARRLLRSGWQDLADLADSTLIATRTDWSSRMLDRVGLLAPRMSQAGNDPELACGDALRDLRTGVTIIELHETVSQLDGPSNKWLAAVLPGVSAHFRALARGRHQPPRPGLLAGIDALIGDMLAVSSRALRHTGLVAAIGLRRNLYPDALPYAAQTQKAEAKA